MRDDFHSIQWPIAVDEQLGTLTDETDYGRHVDQLMRQVLLTNPGERVHRPDFGCGLRRMVFAPNNPAAGSLLKLTIVQSLQKWLGTVIEVEDVTVEAENETLSVFVRYVLRARQERRYLNLAVAL